MYIILCKDLSKAGWSQGSIIAQACHGVSKALNEFKNNTCTQAYLQNINTMTKVVLQVDNQDKLLKLKQDLDDNKIQHISWTEQPENIMTCLVTRPYEADQVKKYFRKCSLYK